MTNKNENKINEQFLSSLEEFLCDVLEDQQMEIINTELYEYGYDVNNLDISIGEFTNEALANSPLNWRNQARQEICEARKKLNSFVKTNQIQNIDRSSIINEIEHMLRKFGFDDGLLVPVHFRNFNTVSDLDLLSLLQQIKYLDSVHGRNMK